MPPKTVKKRADLLLAEKGLAESREQAQALIMEGLVYAPSGRVLKAGTALPESTPLEVRGRLPYVSRGGLKLAQALDTFGLAVENLTSANLFGSFLWSTRTTRPSSHLTVRSLKKFGSAM